MLGLEPYDSLLHGVVQCIVKDLWPVGQCDSWPMELGASNLLALIALAPLAFVCSLRLLGPRVNLAMYMFWAPLVCVTLPSPPWVTCDVCACP